MEVSHLCSATEAECCNDSQALWLSKQKDMTSTPTNCSSRVITDDSWPGSLNLFRDSLEDKKNVTGRSVILNHSSPISSKASNCLVQDQVERVKKSETGSGWRLFGIDIRSNSNILPQPEKEALVSDNGKQAPSLIAELDANGSQKPEILNSTKEDKQVQLEAKQKEAQCKQGSAASTRTRTKVKFMHYFILQEWLKAFSCV